MSRFFTVSFCLFFSYATGVCQGYTFFLSYRLHSEENNLDLGLILKLYDSSLCLDLPIVTLWFGKKESVSFFSTRDSKNICMQNSQRGVKQKQIRNVCLENLLKGGMRRVFHQSNYTVGVGDVICGYVLDVSHCCLDIKL